MENKKSYFVKVWQNAPYYIILWCIQVVLAFVCIALILMKAGKWEIVPWSIASAISIVLIVLSIKKGFRSLTYLSMASLIAASSHILSQLLSGNAVLICDAVLILVLVIVRVKWANTPNDF